MAVQGYPNVIDFGSNRKRVCNFLLVNNGNLGAILPRFEDIAGFLLRSATPPLFRPNFEGVPLGLDCRCWVSEERRPTLINPVITLKLTKLIWPRYFNVTDGRTDGRTTYCSNTAQYSTWCIAMHMVHRAVKTKGKGRYKKSPTCYISRIRGKAPCEPILTKFCIARGMVDMIICTNLV